MIPVTKTFLPPLEEYKQYLDQIWESGWVTNNGQLSQKLEKELEDYLEVPHLQFVSSGTIALQIALRILDLSGQIITTPFSYVATTSSILWEDLEPVYVDIRPDTLTIDPDKIEEAITSRTSAILATHVFGIPCDVEAIRDIADRHDLKVIYDAAHAFGVTYKGQSLLNYGDISALSFHATKLFHTVEGGAVVTQDQKLSEKAFLSKAFGHRGNDHQRLGINGKNSELHAAMGMCLLPRIDDFIKQRKNLFLRYQEKLNCSALSFPSISEEVGYNFSYFPVLFESAKKMENANSMLQKNEINARRYFFPSLDDLKYIQKNTSTCPVSTDAAQRILCLPLYEQLSMEDIDLIASLVNKSI